MTMRAMVERVQEPEQIESAATPTDGTAEPAGEESVYEQLAAPFDSTFRDLRGGVELEYITGEQCVTRLNQVLGPVGWSFVVREHGINNEADEVWVLGE